MKENQLEWLNSLGNIVYVITLLFNLAGMAIGFYVHFRVTETKSIEREKRTNEILTDHKQRIEGLEANKTRKNGQTTYIPRPECDRKHKYLEDLITKKTA